MRLTVGESNLGTPESSWLACRRLTACPALDVGWNSAGKVAVVAPHPDDEVLALGGTMRALARAGTAVTVLAVTDGEASHPRSKRVTRTEMAAIRAEERADALARLDVGDAEVIRLGVPDGEVARVDETLLAERMAASLEGAAFCFAPWEKDGHPDHDASGRAALLACAKLGIPLVQYPIWAWHWAKANSEDMPWQRAHRFDLTPDDQAAKCASIAAYRSQIEPLGTDEGDQAILLRPILSRFERFFEVVFL